VPIPEAAAFHSITASARSKNGMSASGHERPGWAELMPALVRFAPKATIQAMGANGSDAPQADIARYFEMQEATNWGGQYCINEEPRFKAGAF
jgi:hypothetical protein